LPWPDDLQLVSPVYGSASGSFFPSSPSAETGGDGPQPQPCQPTRRGHPRKDIEEFTHRLGQQKNLASCLPSATLARLAEKSGLNIYTHPHKKC